MYPEFIAIYIGLGVLAVLQIITVILVLALGRKLRRGIGRVSAPSRDPDAMRVPAERSGVAFCTNCGAQFSAKVDVCPVCGKPKT